MIPKFSRFAVLASRLFLGSVTMLAAHPALAQVPGAPGASGQPGFLGMVTPFILMFGVVYFLMIRPQQKRMKQQQDMLSALKQGDEVVTTSGILGKVASMDDKIVTLEVASNVRIRILKSQVSQVVTGNPKETVA